jgi:serine/threonine-protein kinase
VVLYEAMSGRVPFSAETHMGVLTKHVFEVPEPIETVVADPTTLGPLGAIIMCCLEKDPAARYKSANDLALAVEHAMSTGFALPADRPQPALRLRAASPVVPAATPRAPKPSGLPKWVWIAVPAGILLGIGFAMISRTFLHRGSTPAVTGESVASAAPESTALRAVSVPAVVAASTVSSIAASSVASPSTSAPSSAPSSAVSVAAGNTAPSPVASPTFRPPHPAASASSAGRPSGVIDTW